MITNERAKQVAREFGMNPNQAWQMLENARTEGPAILERMRRYDRLVGGSRNGRNQDNQKTSGQVQEVEKGDSIPGR